MNSKTTTTTEKRKRGRPRKQDSTRSTAAPAAMPKKKRGRPPICANPEEKADKLKNALSLVAEGYTLPEIEDMAGIKRQTLAMWIADNTGGFSVAYASAREARADRIAREVFEIADKSDGESPAAVNKARLQCDVRKWYLSKILPEKYGDHLEVTGKNGGPLSIAAIGAVGIADIRELRSMIFNGIGTSGDLTENAGVETEEKT